MKTITVYQRESVTLHEDWDNLVSRFCSKTLFVQLTEEVLRVRLCDGRPADKPWTFLQYRGSWEEWFPICRSIVPMRGTTIILKIITGIDHTIEELEDTIDRLMGWFRYDCKVEYCLELTLNDPSQVHFEMLISETNPQRKADRRVWEEEVEKELHRLFGV